jgi:hypothetical protein
MSVLFHEYNVVWSDVGAAEESRAQMLESTLYSECENDTCMSSLHL